MPIFDVKCKVCSLVSEHFIRSDEEVVCPKCDGETTRLIPAPRFKLDGTDPGFPTAYDQWGKKREEKMKQELKQQSD